MLTGPQIQLIHNAVNEIVNGLPTTRRTKTLSSDRHRLSEFLREWASHPSEDLLVRNRAVLAACVQVVIDELGEDEFETRVGLSLDEAKTHMRDIMSEQSRF
jgi:hypothetical protein